MEYDFKDVFFGQLNLTGHQWVMSSINNVSSPGGETENYWKDLRYIRFNTCLWFPLIFSVILTVVWVTTFQSWTTTPSPFRLSPEKATSVHETCPQVFSTWILPIQVFSALRGIFTVRLGFCSLHIPRSWVRCAARVLMILSIFFRETVSIAWISDRTF